MKKITNEYLLNNYRDNYLKLRKEGLDNIRCSNVLGIGPKTVGRLQKLLGIGRLLRWQKFAMPEKFSNKTISLIYGTLMGDASIHIPGFKNTHKSFTVGHCPAQKEYIEHKHNLLSEIKPYPIRKGKDQWTTLTFRTAPHPEFNSIYNDFYSSGSKQITEKILEKLNPEAIALWFMDDGNLINKKGFAIATCSFNEQSINHIIKYFNDKYDINFKISKDKYLRIKVFGQNAIKFKSLIEKYIIPSMKYKLNLKESVGVGLGKAHSWSKEEDNILVNSYMSYMKVKDIALLVSRSEKAVKGRIAKLKLKRKIKT